jgi:hypothetical protein
MNKTILFFLFILIVGLCKAQKNTIQTVHYFPEKVFVSGFEKAAGPSTKIDALGKLAMYHALFCRDSLRDVLIKKIYRIAAATGDPAFVVKAKFWDAYLHSESLTWDESEYIKSAARDLLNYAEEHHFLDYKIAAYNILCQAELENYEYKEAEKNAINASLWLDDIHDDSTKIMIYRGLANVFIWEKDGIRASRYLLKLRDYAEQETNETSKILALRILSALYFDMSEMSDMSSMQKSIDCDKELLRYYAMHNMIYMQTAFIGKLMTCYLFNGDTILRNYYNELFHKMQDSLDIVNYQTYTVAFDMQQNKMMSLEQYVKLLKGGFGKRFVEPSADIYYEIGCIYSMAGIIDSADYYLNQAKINGAEKLNKSNGNFIYWFGVLQIYKNQYPEALKIFSEMKTMAKKNGNRFQHGLSYNGLITTYYWMKDYKSAIDLLFEYQHMKDSLDKLNNKQVITMMEVEKDKEISDRKIKENETKLEHRHNIQYMAMALGALAIILVLILLGLIKAKPWLIRSMSFFSFIFIFEFIILILDNQIHSVTGGEPWKIMMIKVVVIGLLLPLHHFVEKQVAYNLIHKNISPRKWIKTIWGDRIHKPEE